MRPLPLLAALLIVAGAGVGLVAAAADVVPDPPPEIEPVELDDRSPSNPAGLVTVPSTSPHRHHHDDNGAGGNPDLGETAADHDRGSGAACRAPTPWSDRRPATAAGHRGATGAHPGATARATDLHQHRLRPCAPTTGAGPAPGAPR